MHTITLIVTKRIDDWGQKKRFFFGSQKSVSMVQLMVSDIESMCDDAIWCRIVDFK